MRCQILASASWTSEDCHFCYSLLFFSHANLKGRYFHQKAFLVSGLIICLGSLGLQHVTANLELCKYCSVCQWVRFWKDTIGYAIDDGTSVYMPSRNPSKFTRFLLSIAILVSVLSSLWSYHARSVVTRCIYFFKLKIMSFQAELETGSNNHRIWKKRRI